MATLGSLIVTLEANIAKFQSDLGKAATMAEASMNKIAKSIEQVNGLFETLGVGLSVRELVNYTSEVIKASGELVGLKMATGLAVETLSAMKNTGAEAGLSIDEVTGAFERLEKQAALAVGGNKASVAAFDAIHISSKLLAADLKDPQKLLLDVADALEHFADDGNKTAIMMALLGRSGAQTNEFLHNLAETGYQNATVTADQAAKANAFNAELAKMKTWVDGVTLDVAMWFIPAWKLAFTTIVVGFSDMWIDIELGYDASLNLLGDKVMRWAKWMGSLISPKAWLGETLGGPLENMASRAAAAAAGGISGALGLTDTAKATRDAKAAHEQNQRILDEASTDYVNATTTPVVAAAAAKPSIIPPDTTDRTKGLRKALDERLKMLNDAIKLEEEATKRYNVEIDAEYAGGVIALSTYASEKNAALEQSATVTQGIYAQEVAAALKLANSLKDQQDRAAAFAKASDLVEQMNRAALATDIERVAMTEKIKTDQDKLAKTILDVAIAYETLNGNTEHAVALQIQQQDGMTKQILATNDLTEQTKQLAAVEADRMLRASQSGFDGMRRSIIDYAKGLQDVAKQTESITTKMLQGIEDAMVSFVKTGQINWRSLIDSMIADLIRLQIRQSVMPGIAGFFGSLFGGSGIASTGAAAAGTDTGAAASAIMPFGASGGYITVGERGPEKFRPDVNGTLLPNGAGGGAAIHFSQNIQVDSRSDRAQVQADTASAVRKGQQELVAVLRRYNPNLRV
ncbi:MAG TPA: phage tail tape measure C-terminal domain-containing protein [Steroidobacteraceae bacterium]|jgi:lambda family phage tail tape measure protein